MSDRPLGKREVLAGVHDLSLTLFFAGTYLAAPLLHQNPLFAATAIYVILNALAFAVSRNFEEGLLLVAWVSRLTIVVMGTLTLWLHDPTFIKMNRTLYFGLLAAWSEGSILIGPPRLQRFSARDNLRGVTYKGWRRLTHFAACAAVLLAMLNELVWRFTSTGFWVAFQVWGWILAEMLILPLSMPILTRNGAVLKKKAGEPSGTPA